MIGGLSVDTLKEYLGGDAVDFNALRKLSRQKGGFQSNEVRQFVWPVLLGVHETEIPKCVKSYIDSKHRDVQQINGDIERSLWKMDTVQEWSSERRQEERDRLERIINAVVSKNKNLHYYQGFHDICTVFYLIFEDDGLTLSCLEALSLDFIHDAMRENFETILELMRLVFVIIAEVDPELHAYLVETKAEPFFTISWVLTWFAHDISVLENVARLYDAILCSHPVYILYLCSSFAMANREELMKKERDFGSVQNFFVKAPTAHGIPIEDTIEDADSIYSIFPEELLVKQCSSELKKMLAENRVTMLRNIPPSVYADAEDSAESHEESDSHSAKKRHCHRSGKKHSKGTMSAARKLVNEWRLCELKNISQHKAVFFNKAPQIRLFVYRKLGRKAFPLLSKVVKAIRSNNPFSPGFWPALLFNRLLFVDGKKMYLSVFSVAILGGLLGYGMSGYLNS